MKQKKNERLKVNRQERKEENKQRNTAQKTRKKSRRKKIKDKTQAIKRSKENNRIKREQT